MSFENYLEQTISDYLENQIDFSDLINEKNGVEDGDVVDRIDVTTLARFILDRIEPRILKFSGDVYAHQVCSSCGRSFGDFHSEQGGTLDSDLVLKNGRQIIIVDDF